MVREKEEAGLEVDEIVFSFVYDGTGGLLALTDEAERIECFAPNGIPPTTSGTQVERIRDVIGTEGAVVPKEQRGPSSRVGAGHIGPTRD